MVESSNFIDMDPNIFKYILENLRMDSVDINQIPHHKKYVNTLVKLGMVNESLFVKPKSLSTGYLA